MARRVYADIEQKFVEKGMIIISDYINYDTPVCVKCQACGHQRTITPRAVLTRGNGKCPSCATHGHSLPLEVVTEALTSRGITLHSTYRSTGKPVSLSCTVCGYKWSGTITQIIHGTAGCARCAGNTQLTQDQIAARLPDGIRMVGEYTGVNTPTLFECSNHHTWVSTPANYVYSHSRVCPECSPYQHNRSFGRRTVVDDIVFRSKLEADCYIMIKHLNIPFARQVKYPTLHRMTCDFVIRDLWVEVSSINKDRYLAKIQRKREAVEEAGNRFVFVTCLAQLADILELQ